MPSHPHAPLPPGLPAATLLSPIAVGAVLATARALQRSALEHPGSLPALLRGKKLGLMSHRDDTPTGRLFMDCALELGAHVSHVPPSLGEQSSAHVFLHTARMLGRLYDALECQGLPAPVVRRIGEEAGIPVFDALSGDEHPSAQLAALLQAPSPAGDGRRRVLQAMLLHSLS